MLQEQHKLRLGYLKMFVSINLEMNLHVKGMRPATTIKRKRKEEKIVTITTVRDWSLVDINLTSFFTKK